MFHTTNGVNMGSSERILSQMPQPSKLWPLWSCHFTLRPKSPTVPKQPTRNAHKARLHLKARCRAKARVADLTWRKTRLARVVGLEPGILELWGVVSFTHKSQGTKIQINATNPGYRNFGITPLCSWLKTTRGLSGDRPRLRIGLVSSRSKPRPSYFPKCWVVRTGPACQAPCPNTGQEIGFFDLSPNWGFPLLGSQDNS